MDHIEVRGVKLGRVRACEWYCGSQDIIGSPETDSDGYYGFYSVQRGSTNLRVCIYSGDEGEVESMIFKVVNYTRWGCLYVLSSSSFNTELWERRVDLQLADFWIGEGRRDIVELEQGWSICPLDGSFQG